MKVLLDREKCTGLGMCESFAPDHFEIDDDGSLIVLNDQVAEVDRDAIEAAIDSCPTAALRLLA